MLKRNNLLKTLGYVGAVLLCLAPLPTHADYQQASLRYDVEKKQKLALQYDVYAGGMHALNASLTLDLDKKAYDMALEAETQGIIGSLFPWKANYSASGHTRDGVLIPNMYKSQSSWKDKIKITEMDFDPKGKVLKTTTRENDKTTTERDIDDVLSANAVDLLTGALAMMQSARNTSKCAGTFPIFDGKRRFNITLTDAGADTISKSKYSSFSGKALRCVLKVDPVAGFKEKDKNRGWMAIQNHTAERKKMPTLWFGPHPKSGQIVPVRMEISSSYGGVVAHLTSSQAK